MRQAHCGSLETVQRHVRHEPAWSPIHSHIPKDPDEDLDPFGLADTVLSDDGMTAGRPQPSGVRHGSGGFKFSGKAPSTP
jgi:hypothetical protein